MCRNTEGWFSILTSLLAWRRWGWIDTFNAGQGSTRKFPSKREHWEICYLPRALLFTVWSRPTTVRSCTETAFAENQAFTISSGEENLKGLPCISCSGEYLLPDGTQLYTSAKESFQPKTLRFIPYFAWCNRSPGEWQFGYAMIPSNIKIEKESFNMEQNQSLNCIDNKFCIILSSKHLHGYKVI